MPSPYLFPFCQLDTCDAEALGNERGGKQRERSWCLNDHVEVSHPQMQTPFQAPEQDVNCYHVRTLHVWSTSSRQLGLHQIIQNTPSLSQWCGRAEKMLPASVYVYSVTCLFMTKLSS